MDDLNRTIARRLGAPLLVSVLAWLVGVQTAGAQSDVWTTNGPAGERVLALAIDPETPTTLYAGIIGAGVFKSTDGGASWTAINDGLTHLSIRAVAIAPLTPSTLYAGTEGGGVFSRTSDLERFMLTVGTTGDGAGTVSSSPSGIECGTDCSELYASGSTVTLTAAPAGGSVFTGWSR